jgi:two-component system CheB/CheR fusion protein
MNQVIVNLLKNAAEHTDPKGTVWLSCRKKGNAVLISVRDEGEGIPEEMTPRLFELFSRGEHRGRRSPGGLGIGLYLVKMFTELHGGSVHVASKGRNSGAEFSVQLPLAEEA